LQDAKKLINEKKSETEIGHIDITVEDKQGDDQQEPP